MVVSPAAALNVAEPEVADQPRRRAVRHAGQRSGSSAPAPRRPTDGRERPHTLATTPAGRGAVMFLGRWLDARTARAARLSPARCADGAGLPPGSNEVSLCEVLWTVPPWRRRSVSLAPSCSARGGAPT